MKVERWEEESDEDWAERLAEEIALANNTETTKYFVERDSHAEENFIINYIGEDGWTWKEHPEGPFSCKQVLEWKLAAQTMKYESYLSMDPFLGKPPSFNLVISSGAMSVDLYTMTEKEVRELIKDIQDQMSLNLSVNEKLQSSDTTAREKDED